MRIIVLVLMMGFICAIVASAGNGGNPPVAFFIGLVFGIIYFIPAFIASQKKHRNELAIVVLNTVAGWTFIGWVGALIWSLLKPGNPHTKE
jgi:hypothetical protein